MDNSLSLEEIMLLMKKYGVHHLKDGELELNMSPEVPMFIKEAAAKELTVDELLFDPFKGIGENQEK